MSSEFNRKCVFNFIYVRIYMLLFAFIANEQNFSSLKIVACAGIHANKGEILENMRKLIYLRMKKMYLSMGIGLII